jgi:signal transduction histidine kinase
MRSVIHEIKNHLAIAVANVEAFRDGILEPTPARLTAVLQALAEADVLLADLPRDVSAAALPATIHSIDVCAVITNEVLGLEASAQQRGIAFSVQQCERTGAACHAFDGDPVRVAEIVNNVISNAIRYTPPGGRIEVDCRRADGTLMFAVTDSGPGVAAADRQRIFEPGVRGDAAGGTVGSGLGLALARRFAQEHGGSVELLGANGSGAQFVVKLPGAQRIAPPVQDGVISLL